MNVLDLEFDVEQLKVSLKKIHFPLAWMSLLLLLLSVLLL